MESSNVKVIHSKQMASVYFNEDGRSYGILYIMPKESTDITVYLKLANKMIMLAVLPLPINNMDSCSDPRFVEFISDFSYKFSQKHKTEIFKEFDESQYDDDMIILEGYNVDRNRITQKFNVKGNSAELIAVCGDDKVSFNIRIFGVNNHVMTVDYPKGTSKESLGDPLFYIDIENFMRMFLVNDRATIALFVDGLKAAKKDHLN